MEARDQKYEEALADYAAVIRLGSHLEEAYVGRGDVLVDQKKYQEALAAYEKALKIAPQLAAAHTGKGEALRRLGRLPEASTAFQTALDLAPNYIEAHIGLGDVLLDSDQFEEAFTHFEEAINRDHRSARGSIAHRSARASIGKSKALWSMNRPGALLAAEQAIALAPFLAEAFHAKGNALYADATVHAKGNTRHLLEQALIEYEKALQCDRDFMLAHYNKGKTLSALGRYDEAARAYEQAYRLDPTYVHILVAQGNLFREQNKLAEAFDFYKAALQAQEKTPEAWSGIGHIYALLGQYQQASEACNRAIRLCLETYNELRLVDTPHRQGGSGDDLSFNLALSTAYHNRGDVNLNLNKPQEALEDFKKAQKYAPWSVYAYNGMGKAHLRLKHYQEALLDFEEAIKQAPGRPEGYSHKGDALREMKRYYEALQAFDYALGYDATYGDAYLGKGKTYEKMHPFWKVWPLKRQDLEDALQTYRTALDYLPDYTEAWQRRANMCRRLRKFDERVLAMQHISRLRSLDSSTRSDQRQPPPPPTAQASTDQAKASKQDAILVSEKTRHS